MLVSTAFITNIKKCKKNSFSVLQQLSSLPLAHTTPDPFPQGQFKTEPVHCRFSQKTTSARDAGKKAGRGRQYCPSSTHWPGGDSQNSNETAGGSHDDAAQLRWAGEERLI